MDLLDDDFDFEGMRAHVLKGGVGFPLLLIHGSGPGASTMGNWRLLLPALAARYEIHAMDLIGFGGSGRKEREPFFDLELWYRQVRALADRIEAPRFGIIAHSISAVFALRLAAESDRVAAVLTTGAIGAPFTVNDATRRCWTFPVDRAALIRVASDLVHDEARIDDAYLAVRERTLFADAGYAAYFARMFSGDPQAFADATVLDADVLARVTCPVSMLHGRNDVPFPPEVTLALANTLPQADVTLLSACAHSVAMERGDALLRAADALFTPHAGAA